METKTCTACAQELPLSAFGPKQGRCRPCRQFARAEARMRAMQQGTYAPRKRGRQDETQRRLHRARDQVRRWTQEAEKLRQWIADKEAEVAAQEAKAVCKGMFADLWGRDIEKARRRIKTLHELITTKTAELHDLRTQREKAAGLEFDATVAPHRAERICTLELLMHEEVQRSAHERLERLRNETEEQRQARYGRLRDFRLWLRWHLSGDSQQIAANETTHANAHRDALRASERAALRGKDAGPAYRQAYARAAELYEQDLTAGVLFEYPAEWIADANAEIAELRKQEAAEIAASN